jgi:Tfp pilus assembly PilM family ATPase
MKNTPASRDEVASTEKLLQLIRGEREAPVSADGVLLPAPPPVRKKSRFSLTDFIPSKKAITIGVDIGSGQLRLAKVLRLSDNRFRLLGCKLIPYPSPGLRKSPGFHEFLGKEISGLIGSSQRYDIWTTIPFSLVDVRHLRIPKVSKKQIYDVVFWTLKKEAQFDEKETVFDFEIQEELSEKGISKIGVMAYTASRQDVKEVKDLFVRSGFKLAGLTVAPFVAQSLFWAMRAADSDKTLASLHIGSETSRIDIFSGGSLVLTRAIKSGVNSMVESFVEGLLEARKEYEKAGYGRDRSDAASMLTMEKDASIHGEEARKILLEYLSGPHATDQESSSGQLADESIFELIQPAVTRLVRQVERTFEYYATTLGNERVGRLYLTGVVDIWHRLSHYVGSQLGVETDIMDPLSAGSFEAGGVEVPGSHAEKVGFNTALGLAISDNGRTPNLLFTAKAKQERASVARIDRGIFVAFLMIMSVLAGVFFWESRVAGMKKAELAQLQKQLEQQKVMVDQQPLTLLAGDVMKKQKVLKKRSQDLLAVAVVHELTTLTPPDIRLVSAVIDLGAVSKGEKSEKSEKVDKGEKKTVSKSLLVEGIVKGERGLLEASLARYLADLGSTPIFKSTGVQASSFEFYEGEGEVLRFTLKLELV